MKKRSLTLFAILPLVCACQNQKEGLSDIKKPILNDFQKHIILLNQDIDDSLSYRLKIDFVKEDGSQAAPSYIDEIKAGDSFYVLPPEIEGLTPNVPYVEGYIKENVNLTVKYSTLSKWDGSTKTSFGGSGTEADPYLIESAANLAYLANVESSRGSGSADPYAGKYFKLTTNIDLGNHEWTPIATNNAANYARPFQAIFDGDNHLIKGLYINKPSGISYALFGAINSKGVIKNLNVEGEVTGYSRTGILLACNNAATSSVINCQSFGVLTSKGDKSNSQYAGGIVSVNKGTIDGCINHAKIISPSYGGSGGVVGTNSKIISNCENYGEITSNDNSAVTNMGGVLGQMSTAGSSIANSFNYAKIVGFGQKWGGVIGSASGDVTINKCANFGMLEAKAERNGAVIGEAGSGVKIIECANYGFIKSEVNNVGGILGLGNGAIVKECSNFYKMVGMGKYNAGITGNHYGTNATDESCYNYGKIIGYQYVAGIVGYATQDVKNCFNYGEIIGDSYVGGVVSHLLRGRADGCQNYATITGISRVSGVVGYYWFDNNGVESYLKNSYNHAQINGVDMTGGVCGHSQNGIIYSCQNEGFINGSGNYVGGVVGHLTHSSICYSCSNTGDITGASSVGGVIGYAGAATEQHDNTTDSKINGIYSKEKVVGYQS